MNKLIRHEFRENISLFINIILVIVVTLEILYLGVGIIFLILAVYLTKAYIGNMSFAMLIPLIILSIFMKYLEVKK